MPWALFYPADYSIGSANLGFHYVFQRLRESGVAAERFFASPVPYRSVDADTMLERFSVITASVAYEGDIPAFYRWLSGANIPLLAEERVAGSFPVIGMGGALSYINPLTVSGVCDFIILGDGMEVLDHVIESLRLYEGGCGRRELWRRLSESPNILVPPVDIKDGRLVRGLRIGRSLDLNGPYPVHSAWMTERGAFGKTLLLELQRGCARSCSYCTLPRCFGSMRWRKFEIVERALDEITSRFEVPQAGLVTPEAGDYPFLPQLIDKLINKNIGVSFASLRLDRLSEQMILALSGSGRRAGDRRREAALWLRQKIHRRPDSGKARNGERGRDRPGEALFYDRPSGRERRGYHGDDGALPPHNSGDGAESNSFRQSLHSQARDAMAG